MKPFFSLVCFSVATTFAIDNTTFAKDRLESFYAEFLCREKDDLAAVGLSSECFADGGGVRPLPTPPPPSPYVNPLPPPTPSTPGLLPIVIKNNSGYLDSEVYVLIQGRDPSTGNQVFVNIGSTGIGTLHTVSVGDNGNTYSVLLSGLPATSTGGRVIYIPPTDSFLVMLSMENKLNIPVLTGNKIADPAFDNPSDPYGNFNTIWDQVEGAYVTATTPNIAVDATAVSFFSIPLQVYLSTPNSGTNANCGLTQSRTSLINYLNQAFATVPVPPANSQWSKLTLYNGSSPLRVLSPGKSMAAGGFDLNYLDNASSYLYSYLSNIWYGTLGFYQNNTLSIEIPGGKVYSGRASGNTIRLESGSDYVVLGPIAQGPPYDQSTTWKIFSGKNIYSSTSNDSDAIQVSKAFEEAIIAGIVPTTDLINASTLSTLSVFRPYYRVNSNLSYLGKETGPWYDLYSAAIHACGLIYTYAYDEPLWPEVLLQSNTLQPSTYIGITIGQVK